MIPTEDQVKHLWDTYHLPEQKRIHVTVVALVAGVFARKLPVNKKLLRAAALTHDIDKAAPRLPGEHHPDTAVRILKEEGMEEVAEVVTTHSLHSILDPHLAPQTLEQKILYLADKMVKYDIVGVDKRFALWREEKLPPDALTILDKTYPKVKELEKEMFSLTGLTLDTIRKLA